MKNLLIVFLLFTGMMSATAQEVYTSSGKRSYKQKTKRGYDPDRLIVGGGLSASFSTGYTVAGVAPILGYRFGKKFSAGIGMGYLYDRIYALTDQGKDWYYKSHIVYPSVWVRQFVSRSIFFSAMYEHDFVFQKGPVIDLNTGGFTEGKLNYNVPCALVGIGLRQSLGGRVSFIGELMYDVLQQKDSPYFGHPTVRFGIVAGL